VVLAGLAAEPECRSIYVICSDKEFRNTLEKEDIVVSRDQPKGGMIGVAGMVLSLSSTLGVPALGVIAETMGASSDVLAADRMAKWIEQAFEVPLDLDLDTTKETAARLMERIGADGSIEDYLGMEEPDASSDFYV
jgi:proteasome assembly chaperone (PAC2) family protein